MKLKTLLLLLAVAFLISSCGIFDKNENPPDQPPESTETPSPPTPSESAFQIDRTEGELCIFERSLPKEIFMNEPFAVTITMQTKQQVQTAYLDEDGWFREFRKDREPIYLWQGLMPGQAYYYTYEVTMWSSQAKSHPYMTGSVSCNAGGLGLSEELELRSELNLVFSEQK